MTEAIDQQFEDKDKLQHMQVVQDMGGDQKRQQMNPFNAYLDQTEPMNQEKYFNIQNRPTNEMTLGEPTSGENTIEHGGLDNL